MTSSPPTVFVLRHTQTVWNALSRYQGRIDTELSDEGRRQAVALASLVGPGVVDRVYSSPLRRARYLADAIGRNASLPVVVDERLTEIAMGPWEGLTRTEIAERFPEMLEAWESRSDEISFPQGESLVDVASRVRPFMEELFATGAENRAIVVTHDAVVKVAIMLALGLELRHLHRFRMRNGSISILRGHRYPGSVETVDGLGHLTGSPFHLPP